MTTLVIDLPRQQWHWHEPPQRQPCLTLLLLALALALAVFGCSLSVVGFAAGLPESLALSLALIPATGGMLLGMASWILEVRQWQNCVGNNP